jgi:hypothetical protein
MTWYLWFFVAAFALTMFGLGCMVTRAHFIHRATVPTKAQPKGMIPMISNNRANAVLAVFFTCVALVVAVDTVYLQVHLNRFTHGQVDCNIRLLNDLQAINVQRQKVDDAEAQFDIAMQQYTMVAAQKPVIGMNEDAYINLQNKLDVVTRERLEMLETYAQHPQTRC